MIKFLIATASLLLPYSQVAATTAPAQKQLRRLRDIEIRSVLQNARLVPHSDSSHWGTNWPEAFKDRGLWQSSGRRAPLSGEYYIKDDQVCVSYAVGRKFCRAVYIARSGRVFMQDINQGVPEGPVIQVDISKVKP